ncbi:hypothetical protein KXV85_004845 [Aspergillus fumigatus]|nr:hypothetical protein KXV85_004845 [Aspergillus fumigatus]
MRLSIASVVSCLAALAMAATKPDYTQDPTGNAILKPGLNELVPAGKPYTITWDPTTTGPVSLVLLRGPSTNVVPIETLADSIPNSGSFSWTPSTSLEPDTTHYGLLLVVEGTGQYQYSTQFGISNPGYTGSTSQSSSTSPTATETKSSSATESSSSKSSTTGKPETTTTTTPPTTTATSGSASADSTTTASETPATTLVTQSSTANVPTSTVVVSVPNSSAGSSSGASGSPSQSSTPSPSPTLSSGGDRKAISLGAVVQVADMLPTGVAIRNHRDEAIFANHRFRNLMTKRDLRSFDCWPQSVHPDEYDRLATAYHDASRAQQPLCIQYRTRDDDCP